MSDDRLEITRFGGIRGKAERIAEAGDILGGLEQFIKDQDWVTMVEIGQFLTGCSIDTKGNLEWGIDDLNLVFWAGMSDEFCDIMAELKDRKTTQMEATNPMTYLIDGAMLSLPLAKRPPRQGYKDPHWAPICFRHKDRLKPKERVDG